MGQIFRNRYRVFWALLFFYFFPVAFLSVFKTQGWDIVTWGLLFASGGSLALFLMMRAWESQEVPAEMPHQNEVAESPVVDYRALEEAETFYREAQERVEELQTGTAEKEREIAQLCQEKESLEKQLQQISHDFEAFKESSEDKLEQNYIFLGEHQHTIQEQRAVIEMKQQQIMQLESKVRDLTYEIKTLLHIAERAQLYEQKPPGIAQPRPAISSEQPLPFFTDKPVSTQEEAVEQLKRCIDMAQKITGASHYASRLSRIRDLPIDNYALDLRRLFDNLRTEASCAILVYSQKENKILFVNPRIRALLGWNSEKFIQNFPEIAKDSLDSWNQMLSQLAYKNDSQAKLSLQTKHGSSLSVNCHMEVIPTGLFRSNVIGVLYATS